MDIHPKPFIKFKLHSTSFLIRPNFPCSFWDFRTATGMAHWPVCGRYVFPKEEAE